MGFYLKDPGARIDYTVDWAAGYLAGDTITASEWIVVPDEAGGIAVAGTASESVRASATLEGGVPGHIYRVTNRVTLTSGRIEERTLAIRVDER